MDELGATDVAFMVNCCLNAAFKVYSITAEIKVQEIIDFVDRTFEGKKVKITDLLQVARNSPEITQFFEAISVDNQPNKSRISPPLWINLYIYFMKKGWNNQFTWLRIRRTLAATKGLWIVPLNVSVNVHAKGSIGIKATTRSIDIEDSMARLNSPELKVHWSPSENSCRCSLKMLTQNGPKMPMTDTKRVGSEKKIKSFSRSTDRMHGSGKSMTLWCPRGSVNFTNSKWLERLQFLLIEWSLENTETWTGE